MKFYKKNFAMLHIANPIYDTVFKYLLEDDRIVNALLSARRSARPTGSCVWC